MAECLLLIVSTPLLTASPLEDCSTGCKRDFPNSEADGDASPPAKRGRKPKLIVTQGLSGASDDMHEGTCTNIQPRIVVEIFWLHRLSVA